MTIQEILLANNVKATTKGFKYICCAATLDCKNTEIYKNIAIKYNTTYPAVERAMRYSLKQSNFAGIRTKDFIERLKMLLNREITDIKQSAE